MHNFFPCGTMSHMSYLLQVTWTHGDRRIQAPNSDRVDPSPRDPPTTHVLQKDISEFDRMTYRAPRGSPRSPRSASNRRPWDDLYLTAELHREMIAVFINRTAGSGLVSWSWPTGSANRNRSSPEAQSNGGERSWKNSTIADRSNHDCNTIEPQSRRFWREIVVESPPVNRTAIDEWPKLRSWPDGDAIVARSWPDRGEKRGLLWG